MRLVKSFSPSYYSDEVKYERLKLIVFIYNQILKVNVDTWLIDFLQKKYWIIWTETMLHETIVLVKLKWVEY